MKVTAVLETSQKHNWGFLDRALNPNKGSPLYERAQLSVSLIRTLKGHPSMREHNCLYP